MRSYTDGPRVTEGEMPKEHEVVPLHSGSFFPAEIVAWIKELPYWYEDEHALHVHAGLLRRDGVFLHPRDTDPMAALIWTRSEEFFRDYRGKRVIVGHTQTDYLPPELDTLTPHDAADVWAGECVIDIDTGCGHEDGFLTCIELPSLTIYESRDT
jgi:serine/threonine protein phosphatase 1